MIPGREVMFRPVFCLDYMDLEYTSMLDIIAEYKRVEEMISNLRSHLIEGEGIKVRGNIKLAITCLRGGIFTLMVNPDADDAKGRKTVHISIWDAAGSQSVINHGCTLNACGCLSHADAHYLQEKMLRFSEGWFNCAMCGKELKRFTPGVQEIFAGHYCPTCVKTSEFGKTRAMAYSGLD